MREVHRVIADSVLLSDRFDEAVGRIVDKRLAPSGKRIAVVGAGPLGADRGLLPGAARP